MKRLLGGRVPRRQFTSTAACSALLMTASLLPAGVAATEVIPAMTDALSASGEAYRADVRVDEAAAPAGDLLPALIDQANRELAGQLVDDVRFGRDDLEPLADYLNLLFPELDLGAPASLLATSLNEAQLDLLLNLYFTLLDSALPTDSSRSAYLADMGFAYPEYLARRLSELYQADGECFAARAAEDSAAVRVIESPEACAGAPGDQTIWVNRIAPPDLGEAGIAETEVNELLESSRQRYMGDPYAGVGGYPIENLLGLVSALERVYSDSGTTLVESSASSDALMQQLDLMRRSRGMSFEELKSVSLDLQNYLRREGYFLANVYIPRQDFRKATGEVELAVSFGTLGEVTLRNGDTLHNSDEMLLAPFSEYLGGNVSRDIYSAYFEVNDIPGVRITSGLFEPGDNPGETRLVLDVEEQRYQFSLAADNYGSEFTGQERVIATADWYSPLGRGDKFTAGVLQSIDPADSTFGFASYNLPIFSLDHELAISYDAHSYDSVDGRLGNQVLIEGEVESLYAGYDYKWMRSKGLNLRIGFRAFDKQSDTQVRLPLGQGANQVSDQTTDVQGGLIATDGDILMPASRTILGWQASVLYGEQDESGSNSFAEDYTRLSLEWKALTVLPWGPGADISHLAVRFVGAYSDDFLPSFEQTPLGGPFGVRAYESNDFTADTMALLSMDWSVDVGQHLFGDLAGQNDLKVGMFAEAAWGEANGFGSADDSTAELSAYGLLMTYRWRDKLTIDVSLALPGHDSVSDDFSGEISDDDYTALFDIRYLVF